MDTIEDRLKRLYESQTRQHVDAGTLLDDVKEISIEVARLRRQLEPFSQSIAAVPILGGRKRHGDVSGGRTMIEFDCGHQEWWDYQQVTDRANAGANGKLGAITCRTCADATAGANIKVDVSGAAKAMADDIDKRFLEALAAPRRALMAVQPVCPDCRSSLPRIFETETHDHLPRRLRCQCGTLVSAVRAIPMPTTERLP